MVGTGAVNKIGKDAEKAEKSRRCKDFIGWIIIILIFCGLFASGVFIIIENNTPNTTPVYLTDKIIGSVNELNDKLSSECRFMEREGFSDSKNDGELKEIQNELDFVRNKLIEIKIRIKNKTWAN